MSNRTMHALGQDSHRNPQPRKNHRILVIDDNPAIHADFKKILLEDVSGVDLDGEEAALFGQTNATPSRIAFDISFASQGQEALALVQAAHAAGERFSVVFTDVRMPPGWDGLETTLRLWEVDPDLQVVICTAYSDRSWDEMIEKLGNPERLLILKKPFDSIEVLQLAHALTEKWFLLQESRHSTDELERKVKARTAELEAANARLESEIANHRATSTTLSRRERELADFFDNASVGLQLIAADGSILRVNDAELNLLGYTRDEYVGHHFAEFHVDRNASTDLLRRLLAGETVADFEVALRCKDGAIKYVLLDANGLCEDGKFVHARCFARDNTARRIAEDRVREQAALLDKAQDAIFVLSLQGRVLYWNRSSEYLYGWSTEQVLETAIQARISADEEAFAKAMRTAFQQGDWAGELTQRTKQGTQAIVVSRWTLVRDDAGLPKAFLVINTDVTERKQLEAKFLRAQRMESIGTLAGGIAHDLNNILQPISLSVDLLSSSVTDRENRALLEMMSKNAQRATALVKQVLSFARGLEGERVPVFAPALVRDITGIIRETFPKCIQLHLDSVEKPWAINGDLTQLHQVLLNLCVNARDAMPSGGTLTIRLANFEMDATSAAAQPNATAGKYLVITVADTGEGIPLSAQDKIFEPFFTTKKQGEGTGLGLATSLGIIRSHGGFITFDSALGKGTAFHIYLPATEPIAPTPTPTAGSNSRQKGNGELILIVDDEPAIRRIMKLTLESNGYRTVAGCNGSDGVRVYLECKESVDLVITDMAMPVMDGPKMIAALKDLNPSVKIVATTGMTSEANIEAIRELGVKHVLQKPCTMQVILQTVKSLLSDAAGSSHSTPTTH